MRTLNKEEKWMLADLLASRGYKLLIDLVKDFEYDVLNRLKNIDLTNEKDLTILAKNQNYLKWILDFTETIKYKTNKIWKRDF